MQMAFRTTPFYAFIFRWLGDASGDHQHFSLRRDTKSSNDDAEDLMVHDVMMLA
jgi:hypothetical protein